MMADWIEAIQKRIEEVGECKENRVDESKSIFYSHKHSQKLVRKHGSLDRSGVSNNTIEIMPFFGMNLMKYCLKTGKSYPDFIIDGLKLIERNGLKMEGLYRICGNNHVINILKDKLNIGK
jgi:hypothetical protein